MIESIKDNRFNHNAADNNSFVVPSAVSVDFSRYNHSYMGGRMLSVPTVPMTYYDWALLHSDADGSSEKLLAYMNTEAAKLDYYNYYLSEGKLTWSGNWMTGGIDRADGSFEPISYRAPFINSAWDKWNGESWYTTYSGVKSLLREHLAGKTGDLLCSIRGITLQKDAKAHNKACFPNGYSSYFSYTYVVPGNGGSCVSMSISDTNGHIRRSTRLCVMHNGKIVWPSGDDVSLSDSSTWACGFYDLYDMLTSEQFICLEKLRLCVTAGDMIHFVVTDLEANTVRLDPVVRFVNEEYVWCTANPEKTAAIPALPGETLDLWCYSLRVGNETVSGTDIKWYGACDALVSSITGSRYVLAPDDRGEYKLAAVCGERRMAVVLAVCDGNGNYSVNTAKREPSATVDISGIGDKARAADAKVPDYWEWTLKVAVGKVLQRARLRSELSSFLLVGDMHWEGNAKNAVVLANYLMAETGIDRLIFAGDILNGDPSREVALQTFADWRSNMQGFNGRWYAVHGNHDNNGAWAPNTLNDVLTDDEYYDIVTAYSSNARNDGTKKLYNYADNSINKIRYYFLSDDAHGFTKDGVDVCSKEGVNSTAYTEQVEWLRDTSLELEEGWGIVVAEHRMISALDQNGDPIPSEFYKALIPVLDVIGERLEIIAVLSGHTHYDAHIITNTGYPVIAVSCDGGVITPDPFYPTPTPGANDEQRFDIVQIDRTERKIYMTRIGSGADREFDY